MNTNEPQEQVVLARVLNEMDAQPIVAALDAAKIPATMTGGFTAGFIAEAPGDIQIRVFQHDLDAANKILEQFEIDTDEIDWNQVDVGDPKD